MEQRQDITIVAVGMLAEKLFDIDIVKTKDHVKYTKAELTCLTKNIYYEAGVENTTGKYAVAQVTLNRLKTGYWGHNVCKVVYSKAQFSWTLIKHLPKPNPVLWAQSQQVAIDTLHGTRVRGLMHSLYYHADYIATPNWADQAYKVGQVGAHIFYSKAKESWITV
jgi:spore germination cell wall hydrolase CwlJ-like protein